MNPKLNVSEMLDKVKLPNTFLALGFIVILITATIKYETGLKIGVITLVFGAIFRILNILNPLFPRRRRGFSFKIVFLSILKFVVWLLFIMIYCYFINKHLTLI